MRQPKVPSGFPKVNFPKFPNTKLKGTPKMPRLPKANVFEKVIKPIKF